jgi:putative SOS response-associated peptidase YedK
MCGRFTQRYTWKEIYERYQAIQRYFDIVARFNIAPTQTVAAVRLAEDGRELVPLRWGLIPSWTKEPGKGPLLINARADTVHEKPSFRSAFNKRRCLIPADGYYEWMEVAPKKRQPYLFEIHGGEPFAFAGLWGRWEGPSGPAIESCTIITTEAK